MKLQILLIVLCTHHIVLFEAKMVGTCEMSGPEDSGRFGIWFPTPADDGVKFPTWWFCHQFLLLSTFLFFSALIGMSAQSVETDDNTRDHTPSEFHEGKNLVHERAVGPQETVNEKGDDVSALVDARDEDEDDDKLQPFKEWVKNLYTVAETQAQPEGVSYSGIYTMVGITATQTNALANDIALLIISLIYAGGNKAQVCIAWAQFVNVASTRGLEIPTFSDFRTDLISLLMERLSEWRVSTTDATLQAGGISEPLKILGGIMKSEMLHRFVGLVSLLAAALFYFKKDEPFNLRRFLQVESEFKSRYCISETMDFVSSMTQTIDFFLTRGWALYNGDVGEAFSYRTPYGDFMIEYNEVAAADGAMVMERSWAKKLAHLARIRTLRTKGLALIPTVKKEQSRELCTINARITEMFTAHSVRLRGTDIKYKPFTVLLHGPSGQAKTMIISYLLRWARLGLDIPDENQAAINWANLADGFDNTYDSAMWADIFDDIAAGVPSPGDGLDAAVDALLRRSNNVPYIVPKAFGDKGLVNYNSMLLIATTNNPNLNLKETTICPLAFIRRIDFRVELKLKPQFTKADGTLDKDKVPNTDPLGILDMWNFTITVAVPSANGSNMPDYKITKIFNRTLSFLEYFRNLIVHHDKVQQDLLAGVDKIQSIQFCQTCADVGLYMPYDRCQCTVLNSDSEGEGPSTNAAEVQALTSYLPRIGTLDLFRATVSADFRRAYMFRASIGAMLAACDTIMTVSLTWFLDLTHTLCSAGDYMAFTLYWIFKVIVSRDFRRVHLVRRDNDSNMSLIRVPFIHPQSFGRGMSTRLFQDCHRRVVRPMIECYLHFVRRLFTGAARRYLDMTSEQRTLMAVAGTSRQQMFGRVSKNVVGAIAIAAGVYACFKVASKVSAVFQMGISEDEEDQKYAGINGAGTANTGPYFRSAAVHPVVSKSSSAMSNSTDPELEALISRNLFHAVIRHVGESPDDSKITRCNGLKVKHGRMIFPNHAIPNEGTVHFRLRKTGEVGDGGRSFTLTQSQITRDPEHDIAMVSVNIAVVGSSDVEQFFLSKAKYIGKIKAWLFARREDKTGEPGTQPVRLVRVDFSNLATNIDGSSIPPDKKTHPDYPKTGLAKDYFGGVPDTPTEYGDCGAPLIGQVGHKNSPVIMGIHNVAVRTGIPWLTGATVGSYSVVVLQEDLLALHAAHEKASSFQCAIDTMPITQLPEHRNCVLKTPLELSFNLHQKAAFNYYPDLVGAEACDRFFCLPIANISGHRRRTTTSLYRSPIADTLPLWDINNTKVPIGKFPEYMPHRLFLNDLSSEDMSHHPRHLIRTAALNYEARIASIMPAEFRILTLDEAVNGIPGTLYIDAVNQNTSGGFGLEGPKHRYLDPDGEYLATDSEGNVYIIKRYRQEIYDEVEAIKQSYLRGERRPAIFSAVNKDELLSEEKANKGKLRQIFSSPLPYTLLVRQYLMEFVAVMQTHRNVTEAAVGMNAMGPQWGHLKDYLTAFGSSTCFDGDFKGFDKSVISGEVLDEVLGLIYRIVAPRLPTDDDRKILRGILSEMSHPAVDFHGSLVVFNMNPSGNPITVIINCIGNSIIARAVWCMLHPDAGLLDGIIGMYDIGDEAQRACAISCVLARVYETPATVFESVVAQFNSMVHLITYGDDNVFNVHGEAYWFNHTLFAAAAIVLSIEYTHADKSDPRVVRVPYKSIEDVSFLKRTFRTDPETGITHAPLDKASFANMLYFNRKSHLMSPMALTAASIHSWVWESVQHGRDYYDFVQRVIEGLIEAHPDLGPHLVKVPGTDVRCRAYNEVIESCYQIQAPTSE